MQKVLGDLLLTAWAAREKFGSSRHGHGVEGGARSASKDWKLPTGRPSAGGWSLGPQDIRTPLPRMCIRNEGMSKIPNILLCEGDCLLASLFAMTDGPCDLAR